MSKALGAPVLDVMAQDYSLFRELELIIDADHRAEARRRSKANAKAGASRTPGRGRRR